MALSLTRLLLTFHWATLALSRAVSRHDLEHPSLLARQDELPLGYCETSCELGGCGSALCSAGTFLKARSQIPWVQGNESTSHLAKRAFGHRDPHTYMADLFNSYMPNHPRYAELNQDPIIHGDRQYFGRPLFFQGRAEVNGQEVNVEVPVSHLKVFGGTAFQMLSAGLHGCTQVTLVSRRAVWMAHYWESYSLGKPEPKVLEEMTADQFYDWRDTSTAETWTERVLKHIRGDRVRYGAQSTYNSRITGRAYIQPADSSVGIDPDLFNHEDDEPKLFIMASTRGTKKNTEADEENDLPPEEQMRRKLRYPKKMESIVNQIRRTLGFRGEGKIEVNIYPYLPLDYDNPDDEAIINETERGMALFQYDPTGANGQPAWRLFYEGSCYQSANLNHQC
ncbi:hypothetical protein VTJ04DRAFT_8655 [Mycothermus thermophilus]|uniref:uncharacterized protein n=1 Tax=Humicola insolens TaxID=85995 RepID=UPI003743FCDF